MRQRSDLDSMVETILVDAYGDDERYVAFLTVIEEETRLPRRGDAARRAGHGHWLRLHQ
jgi:hypothetical protein